LLLSRAPVLEDLKYEQEDESKSPMNPIGHITITFTSNGKSCKAAKAIGLKYKNIIAVCSATEKKIQVVVDGKVECSVSAETCAESKDSELQLGSLGHHIEAKVAKPTCVGSGVRLQEADLFFKANPQCIGA
jgi:hypothetical protein